MKNLEVARPFDLMADVLELRGENPFRVRAYRRAARSLESLTEDVEAPARGGRLDEIPGVGADLAGKIQEYLGTGAIKEIAAASRGVPRGVVSSATRSRGTRAQGGRRPHRPLTLFPPSGGEGIRSTPPPPGRDRAKE